MPHTVAKPLLLPTALLALGLAGPVHGDTGDVVFSQAKISDTAGGFTGGLSLDDRFATAVAHLGDLDGDGLEEVAVGSRKDDDGGVGSSADRGAVWILTLNPDGSVQSHQKISDTSGLLSGVGDPGGVLDDGDNFGVSVAALGDLDGDTIPDLAVGSGDGGASASRGAIWILFLHAGGTVKAKQKISETAGGFGGTLHDFDFFGAALAAIGDVDGDGVVDLAAGEADDDGGSDRGAAWILLLNADGTVKGEQKINDTVGGFGGVLDDGDRFAFSVGSPGDLDADGVPELAAGTLNDDDGGADRGALWILFLNPDGTVKSEQKISDTTGGLSGPGNPGGVLGDGDLFGFAVSLGSDFQSDTTRDIAVGAPSSDGSGADRGAVWILSLDAAGAVASSAKLGDTAGGFGGSLSDSDLFGSSVAFLGDIDDDGLDELAAGAPRDDDEALPPAGGDRGALWVVETGIPVTGTLTFDTESLFVPNVVFPIEAPAQIGVSAGLDLDRLALPRGIATTTLGGAQLLPPFSGVFFGIASLTNTADTFSRATPAAPLAGGLSLSYLRGACPVPCVPASLTTQVAAGIATTISWTRMIASPMSPTIFVTQLNEWVAAPWTTGTVTLPTTFTPSDLTLTGTTTRMGFAKGPSSMASTAAQASGAVQLVAPIAITSTNLATGDKTFASEFAILTLHLAPEPSRFVLLSTGALLLVLLGCRRRNP